MRDFRKKESIIVIVGSRAKSFRSALQFSTQVFRQGATDACGHKAGSRPQCLRHKFQHSDFRPAVESHGANRPSNPLRNEDLRPSWRNFQAARVALVPYRQDGGPTRGILIWPPWVWPQSMRSTRPSNWVSAVSGLWASTILQSSEGIFLSNRSRGS